MSTQQNQKGSFLTFFMNYDWYKKYLLPGFISQSVLIAGGYGTGRELVEYFVQYGPKGGLMGMGLTFLIWAAFFALTYEFARAFRAYDYKTFFKALLGPGWIAYEIAFVVLLFLIMGVVGAASGSILKDSLGVPSLIGSGIFLLSVAYLTFNGSKAIEVALSWWSYILYIVYVVVLVLALSRFEKTIAANFTEGLVKPGWALGGFQYAFYNMAVTSTVLFALNYLESRREAILAGIMAAFISMIPALFLYIAMIGIYPDVLSVEIPSNEIIARLGTRFLLPLWIVVLFGTMIETGVGFFHTINERINATLIARRGIGMNRTSRAAVGVLLALVGMAISNYGLIGLIAKGYGTISWAFFILQGVGLFTLGLYKLAKKGAN
ncbi:YkvI family membrane protein [Fretibacterium sp. OH1220_COT-178]|uniref:YkvI family membrane protein n=1 Tax=Fretibacterium sp. OH1220_COT-178 TaxID=2491047 RepID=UPI000F5D9EAE|nr:hypothetical protein [Fretibacterium sp. OH1220_COT-178]RRD65151.1 hypothetical protein EII26_04575 [Fretibacterium sp. OH1220_COT-178]